MHGGREDEEEAIAIFACVQLLIIGLDREGVLEASVCVC